MDSRKEITIDSRDLFFSVLLKWRWIVVCGLCFAVLGGVYGYFYQLKAAKVAAGTSYKQLLANGKDALLKRVSVSFFQTKYILIGFVVGILLVVFVYMVRYVLNKTVKTASDIETNAGVTVLAEIHFSGMEKVGLCGVDRWLLGRKNRILHPMSTRQAYDMAVTGIRIACDHRKICKLFVTGSFADDRSGQVVAHFSDSLGNVQTGACILYSSDALQAMYASDGVLFVETIGKSTYSEIRDEIAVAKRQGVPIIGVVAVSDEF